MHARHLPTLVAAGTAALLVCASPAAAQPQRSAAMPGR